MQKGKLIVISGPSGTGKGTVCKKLLSEEKDLKISVSATTRNPRLGEVDGVNYHFLDQKNFEAKIEKDDFLEYAKVYDQYYGTPREYVLEEIEKGECVLLEIDIQGALQVKEKYPEGIFIFLLPPSMEELKKRIIGRGTESEESFNKRFKSAYDEIEYVKEYDYFVINDEVQKAVSTIQGIIQSEKHRVTKDIFNTISNMKEEGLC